MGLQFFPRGGSAHVARNLARNLPAVGWDATLVSGSLDVPGRPGNAREFYGDLDVRPFDMTEALASPDPMRAERPMHPSFEDRPGEADRVFASLDDATFEHHAHAWARALAGAGAAEADVLHLHHLTPINAAAELAAPDVPVVGHLHGTELLMLEAIEQDPDRWAHGPAWAERMRGWAARAQRLIVLSDSAGRPRRAAARHRPGALRAGGQRLRPGDASSPATSTTRPTGGARWSTSRAAGRPARRLDRSVTTTPTSQRSATTRPRCSLYVGRYTEVKRLPLLIEAYAEALPRFGRRAPLVLVGGFPGEWEGEHPLETIRRTGARDVFLAGWHEPRGAAGLPRRRRRRGPPLGARAVRPGAGRGRRLRPAVGRRERLRAGGDHPRRRHRLAGRARRPRRARRSARGGRQRARGAPPPRERASEDARARYAWPALAERVAGVYESAR